LINQRRRKRKNKEEGRDLGKKKKEGGITIKERVCFCLLTETLFCTNTGGKKKDDVRKGGSTPLSIFSKRSRENKTNVKREREKTGPLERCWGSKTGQTKGRRIAKNPVREHKVMPEPPSRKGV